MIKNPYSHRGGAEDAEKKFLFGGEMPPNKKSPCISNRPSCPMQAISLPNDSSALSAALR